MSNQEVAKILNEIGDYLAMQEIPFKPRAYQKAADAIFNLEEDVEDVYRAGGRKALLQIPGVGQTISEKIEEYLKTGKVGLHEELKRKMPVSIEELSRVEGLGPMSAKRLYEKLGIRTIKELEEAAKKGKIRKVPGFGPKSEENILKSIGFLQQAGERRVLGFIEGDIKKVEKGLRNLKETKKVTVAGSVRRRKETIGDVDFVVVSENPERVMEYFVNLPQVVRVLAHGGTKSSVKISSGLDMDLRVIPEESYGAALNYFTGSKAHNVALRQIAMGKGCKLNEYGLFKKLKGGKERMIAGASEEEIYKRLGLSYIPPELRENTGEIELAAKGDLPDLIGYDDLEGDLQAHSDWTDGKESIKNMALAALRYGLKYLAITDHTEHLAMTRGLNKRELLKQMSEIDRVNKELKGRIRVLKGTECDILKDGSLDLDNEILKKLDVVGVAIHSYFNLTKEDQTNRLIRAISNPNVDILFHPTGRIINKRGSSEIDLDKIIETARKTNTVLEVDAYPNRLDLKDEQIRRAISAGIKICVDSDSHAPGQFAFLKYGIAQARRGFAEEKDVINSYPADKMLKLLKKNHDTST